MDAQRAKDLLAHITKDEDYGRAMMDKLTLTEAIAVSEDLLNVCINEADRMDKANDATYFSGIKEAYRPLILEKIRSAQHLWIIYSDVTGYPYTVDGDMLVIYDYAHSKEIINKLNEQGYMVVLSLINAQGLAAETAHMYRNGYHNIRFVSSVVPPFIVEREELYSYEQSIKADYVTNPALQQAMIALFQETRKNSKVAEGEALKSFRKMLQKREQDFVSALQNAEYMIPCIKTERGDETEIAIQHIDVTKEIGSKDGTPVIAIPVFTDGFEMDKCYPGQNENMLCMFQEVLDTIAELGANGIIINALGVSQFLEMGALKEIIQK